MQRVQRPGLGAAAAVGLTVEIGVGCGVGGGGGSGGGGGCGGCGGGSGSGGGCGCGCGGGGVGVLAGAGGGDCGEPGGGGLSREGSSAELPDEGAIFDFVVPLYRDAAFSSVCLVVALVYVERLFVVGRVPPLRSNWISCKRPSTSSTPDAESFFHGWSGCKVFQSCANITANTRGITSKNI